MIEPGSQEELAFADSAVLAGFMPYVHQEVDKALKLCDRRAEVALSKNQLTPEVSHLLYLERLMWLRLRSRFGQRSQVATATLQPEAPGLTIGAQLGDY